MQQKEPSPQELEKIRAGLLLDPDAVAKAKQKVLEEAEAAEGAPTMNRKARRRLAALKRKART